MTTTRLNDLSSPELVAVLGSLHHEFDTRLGVSAVDAEIHRAALRLVDARIPTFVPLLLRRHAAHGLRERLEGSARLPDQPVRVTSRPGREDGEPPHSVYT